MHANTQHLVLSDLQLSPPPLSEQSLTEAKYKFIQRTEELEF